MRLRPLLGIVGSVLLIFGAAFAAPLAWALLTGEPTVWAFSASLALTTGCGAILRLQWRRPAELRARDGFLVTSLIYVSLGFVGAIPFWLAPGMLPTFADAAFESFSGITTTGASVLAGLDEQFRSILLYRSLLQWIGGMGIIVLAVAVLPMLGVGGMQLYRTETPGSVKDKKLTPRITQTAQALWYIYLGITVLCAGAYFLAGMSWFDAMCHAFTTVAIGGFSTHDASIGHFDSAAVEWVAIGFMILSGINFSLHFTVWNRRDPRAYARDSEVRFYLCFLSLMAILVFGRVWFAGIEPGTWLLALRETLFQTVSFATTTGFATTDYEKWPSVVPALLLITAFVGGCAGSTAGGIKVYRIQLILRQGVREVNRLVHPHGVFPIKLGPQPVSARVIDAVWGFFAAYVAVFALLFYLFLLVSGMDFKTSLSAVAACLNNLGPGLGDVAEGYASLSAPSKLLLVCAMTLGRLEIFTVLVLFTARYWRP